MKMKSSKSSSIISEQKHNTPFNDDEVRIIDMSECLGAAECLAKAFEADTLARYFVDAEDTKGYSKEHKWKLHSDILRYMVAAHCLQGFVTTIGPNYDSVALW
jgi:hypothetical protein